MPESPVPLLRLRVVYDIGLLSPNRTRHRMVIYRHAKALKIEVGHALEMARADAWTAALPFAGPVAMVITSYRTREMDRDNLVACQKKLIDALKAHKIIVDDNPRWVPVLECNQHIVPRDSAAKHANVVQFYDPSLLQ